MAAKKLLKTDDVFHYETTITLNDTNFEVYVDDYGMSYIIAWKDPITKEVKEWNCGMGNHYENDLEDIAAYVKGRASKKNEQK